MNGLVTRKNCQWWMALYETRQHVWKSWHCNWDWTSREYKKRLSGWKASSSNQSYHPNAVGVTTIPERIKD
jgi:hypothetical protein